MLKMLKMFSSECLALFVQVNISQQQREQQLSLLLILIFVLPD